MFLEAEQSLGITLSMRGLLAPAREHFEQGLAIYDPDRHRDHPFVYGQDSKVVCLCHVATVLWLLGEPDAALARCHEALHLARSLAHPFSRSWALYYTAMVHQLRREAVPTQEYAEALIALCQDQGFTYRQLQGNILRSWALSEQGLGATEIDQLRQGLEAVRATGAEVYRPYYLAILADVYAKVGQHQTALTGLDEILAIVETTHERFYEAELHRLKGEMLMALGNTDGRSVDSCFHLALHIARQQGAKSLELRTALSRSRLWQRQGRPEAARELLAGVTARFSPELETPELRSARQLLAQLA
jgi:predicted ATPase